MVYFMENPIGLGLAATPHDFGNRNGVLECQQRADVGCPRRFLLTFFGEIQLLGLPKRFSLFEFCEKKNAANLRVAFCFSPACRTHVPSGNLT
jgi:hypothetical protein